MSTNGHTKRSGAFLDEIGNYLYALESNDLDKLSPSMKARLGEILQCHTTDSACVVKAAEDEPIFVLRGKDPVAPNAVEAWVNAAEARDLHGEKLVDAQDCADEMVGYLENRR